jgi:tRNA-Thr(GGU) m(6)t(6)A37 methyltransferase TsaA
MLRPVGIIRNNVKKPILVTRDDGIKMDGQLADAIKQYHETRHEVSKIIIHEKWIEIIDGIEEYSHLVVLYWAHKVPEQSRSITRVHPMGREELPKVGIFCTCSPARPNPLLMTVVKLCGRKKNILEVTGLDAVDSSPVIDIKPYVKEFYPQKEVIIPEWMKRILREVDQVIG